MGDFSANFKRPSTGIHTVEGAIAGHRAATLSKQRQTAQKSFDERKAKIQNDSLRTRQKMSDKFDSNTGLSTAERVLREKTVGLVTAEEFARAHRESEEMAKRKKEGLFDDGDGAVEGDQGGAVSEKERVRLEKRKRKLAKAAKKRRKKALSVLSFAGAEDADGIVQDEEDDDDKPSSSSPSSPVSILSTKELKKNPEVDTSFLPDRERQTKVKLERQRLRTEWIHAQTRIKTEKLEITYSYWDGSGHRRTVQCLKGDSIAAFLELVRKDLAREFREMQNVTSDALLYVKEDLIIPQDITFYDLIVTKARGKSGPLFNFDVHDDIRIGAIDTRVEKDESHPGKIVERRWYERNKHIFPASRWEVFDPAKDYGRYTIHGDES